MINVNDRHDKTPMTGMSNSDTHDRVECVRAPQPKSRPNGGGFEMMGQVRIWGDTLNPASTLVPLKKTRDLPSLSVLPCDWVWLAAPYSIDFVRP